MSTPTSTPLARSFAIQCRVVGALLMREILTRYGRHNIGFLWIFFEPMSFTLGVTALWNAAKIHHAANISITAFAVTGYSSILLWRNCANRCTLAILPNASLLHHRNVRVIDLFWARLLLEIAGASMSFSFLTIIFSIAGIMDLPKDISLVLGGWLYLIVVSCGLGFIVGALSERSETFDRIWHTIAYLLFPLSGAAFLVDWLPKQAQQIVLLLPMVHASEMIRAGFFGVTVVKPHYDISYMIPSALIMLLIGLMLVRSASAQVTHE